MIFQEYVCRELLQQSPEQRRVFWQKDVIAQALHQVPFTVLADECRLLIVHHCEEIRIGACRFLLCFDKKGEYTDYITHTELFCGRHAIVFQQSLREVDKEHTVCLDGEYRRAQERLKNCIRSLVLYELSYMWIKQWLNQPAFACTIRRNVCVDEQADLFACVYENWFASKLFSEEEYVWYRQGAEELRRCA